MHLRRVIALLFCMLIVESFIFVNYASADDEIEHIVDATFTIEFESGTSLKINIEINPQRLTLPEKTYNENEIKNANEEDIGSFRYLLYQMLERQLEVTFENAKFINFSRPAFNGNNFNMEMEIKLTSSFFGLNDSVDYNDFINGLLDIEAWVNYTLNLKAEPGWNNTYLIDLGENIDFKSTNGILQGDYIKWIMKNWNSKNPDKIAKLQLFKINPTTSVLNEEDIFFEMEVDSKNVKKPSLSNNILVNSADITVFDILPNFIENVRYVPSDALRLFVDNGFISWNDCYINIIKPLEEKTISTFEESSFNQTLDFEFNWDNSTTDDCTVPYEVSNMDKTPPLKAILKDDDVNLKICDVSNRAFFGLINSGAEANISREDVNFGDDLTSLGYNYTLTLLLPEKIYLDGENVYTWNNTNPISGAFESENVISYENEDKFTLIEIEVKSTDLNLLSFFTGKTEFTFGLHLNEIRNYNVTKLPDEFIIPKKILLDYFNSDAFRLCVEENVFSEIRINEFLDNEKELFEDRLKNMIRGLDVNTKVNRDIFDESIYSWNGNISDMDAETPVITNSYAHSTYSVPFDMSYLPPGVNIPANKFNFTKIPNQDVTYKIIFPEGISIDVNDPYNKSNVEFTKDEREVLIISFNASDSDSISQVEVTCKMNPSAFFIVGIFSPCLISFVIAIILILIIYIIRRKRKAKKIPTITEEEEPTGYEEEDYYVPPPPGSK